MNIRRRIVVIAAGAALSLAGALPLLGQTERVTYAKLQESLSPIPISQPTDMTEAVFGIMPNDPLQWVDYPLRHERGDPSFLVYGVDRDTTNLCIRITRAQAGYSAGGIASVPSGAGPARVRFQSSPEARLLLHSLRPTAFEMAIHVTPQDHGRCSTTSPMLSASWGDAQSGTQMLLVGGMATGSPLIRFGSGDMQSCRLISQILQKPDLGAGNYAYACPIQVRADQCGRVTSARVLWFEGSRMEGKADVRFKFPCTK